MARSRSARAGGIQMTEGPLYKNILLFSVPLIFSQLLQVLFNMADVAVVGKFSSATALGSVGSTSTLVTLFTGFLIGLSNGVNVRVAQYLGARQEEDTRNCVHTALILCTLSGLVIAVLCFFLAAPMLELLKTKDDLLPGAVLYFRIYALGMPALGIFNFGNAVLSASGDTKRPLAYLTAAGILNVILNLFFVIRCHMAAEGVAVASVIAQCLSALLIVLHLLGRKDACRLCLSRLRVHPQEARRVLTIGIPTGLQNAIFAIANLFVQVGVNSFDAVTVSGAAAAANADTLLFNMMAAFYTGCASFVSRNWGAGKTQRITKSYLVSMCYAAGVGAICGVLLLLFGRSFLSLFANETGVIDAGMERLRIMSFSYVVSPLMDASIAASRGIGKSVVPTVIVVMGSCVFRVIWVYTIFAWFGTITSLYLLYIFSWAITGIAELLYFRRSYKKVILAQQNW